MKTLLTISALVFTVMFSSTSYAGWTKLGENVDGDTFYVDFKRIRKHDGYVYFWYLNNYFKPNKYGNFSSKIYQQGDCKIFRVKYLSGSFHKEPMGGGTAETIPVPESYKDWRYPSPTSSSETVLKSVCSR